MTTGQDRGQVESDND